MSYTGKAVRLERIMDRSTWRTVIVPMDHGMSVGPINGLVDMAATVDKVAEGGRQRRPGAHRPALARPPPPRQGHRADHASVGLDLAVPGPQLQGAGDDGRGGAEDGRGRRLGAHQHRRGDGERDAAGPGDPPLPSAGSGACLCWP